jgi:hypothetical protein
MVKYAIRNESDILYMVTRPVLLRCVLEIEFINLYGFQDPSVLRVLHNELGSSPSDTNSICFC